MANTPSSTPTRTPKPRKDARPTLTLKGDEFGPEFRTLLNKAAAKQGMTQAAFVSEILTREAQKILKGTPSDTPQDNPHPPALMTERLDAQDRALAALADQVNRLTAMQQLSLWQRVRMLLGSSPERDQPKAA